MIGGHWHGVWHGVLELQECQLQDKISVYFAVKSDLSNGKHSDLRIEILKY